MEFALVLPFLLLFALGLVLMSEVAVAQLALERAAAEGARAGALTNDDGEIRAAVRQALAPLDPVTVALRVDPPQGRPPRSRDPRGSIIRISLDHVVAAPLAFAGLPAVRVHATAARLIEWTP